VSQDKQEKSKSDSAEARTNETRGFMQQVRIAATRKFTPEEKIRVVLEGFRREVSVIDPISFIVLLSFGWAFNPRYAYQTSSLIKRCYRSTNFQTKAHRACHKVGITLG